MCVYGNRKQIHDHSDRRKTNETEGETNGYKYFNQLSGEKGVRPEGRKWSALTLEPDIPAKGEGSRRE